MVKTNIVKTNVMVEVDEKLYQDVILPYKQKKSFGKLVVQLLYAFYENDAIYSYINGIMDDIEGEASEELMKNLQDMVQSLNNIGMMQNEAEAVIENGKNDFENWGNNEKEETTNEPVEKSVTKEEVVEIVNDSLKDIKEMLNTIISKGVSVNGEVSNKGDEDTETKTSSGVRTPGRVVEREGTAEEEEEAKNAMANLLDSLSF